MIIYGSSISPYVRKVLAFAVEVGIDLQNKPTIPRSTEPEFREASPFGKVPALRDGDFLLSDSSAIVAYLDATKPQFAMIPQNARARAKTIWWDEFADTILFDTVMKTFLNRVLGPSFQTVEWDLEIAERSELEELPALLDHLEAGLGSGSFLVGDQLTLADIAVVSPWVNMIHSGVRPSPSTYPKTSEYLNAMLARRSFARVIEKERAFLSLHGVFGAW